MKNCKNLSTSEVQMIMNGANIFVEPISDKLIINEDPSRYKLLIVDTDITLISAFFQDLKPEITPWISPIPSPYQPGQTIYGREPWGNTFNSRDNTLNNLVLSECPSHWLSIAEWNSPATMPHEAARIFLRIDEVQVKQCQDLTQSEALSMIEDSDEETCSFTGKTYRWFKNYDRTADDLSEAIADPLKSFESYYIDRFGFESWERNDWIWVYSFTKVEKPTT